tara:strand:+ start:4865 stop:6085 length:1221 start_codon:yes stop_codon:yes gene_type:complete
MKINKCRNCKSTNLIKLFSLGNLSFTGKFPRRNKTIKKAPLNLMMCAKCRLVQLAHNYNLKYLYGPDYGYRTGINVTMKRHVSKVTRLLTKMTNLKQNDAALDIASNDGTLLKQYPKNIITFGIDPLVKKYIKNYSNINFKISDFFSLSKVLKKTKKKFKVISALAVFYDLENPNKFLSEVESILDDDGVFLIEIAELLSMLKYNMFDAICHEHLTYYTSKVVVEMSKKNNLRVFDIKVNDINGGSTQYFICKKNAIFKDKTNKIKKILNEEKRFKLDKKDTYLKFILNINKIKEKVIKIIKKAKLKNNKIHGYGASTKGNVILQYFGIGKREIDFIADRNPKKYNQYTPGTNIKIISENKSRKAKPDYYFVLPWHFRQEILKREKKTISKGSKFIFPLPQPKIYR